MSETSTPIDPSTHDMVTRTPLPKCLHSTRAGDPCEERCEIVGGGEYECPVHGYQGHPRMEAMTKAVRDLRAKIVRDADGRLVTQGAFNALVSQNERRDAKLAEIERLRQRVAELEEQKQCLAAELKEVVELSAYAQKRVSELEYRADVLRKTQRNNDTTYYQVEQRAKAAEKRAEKAEAVCVAMREALQSAVSPCRYTSQTHLDTAIARGRRLLDSKDPAALILTRLEAAEAVVKAVQTYTREDDRHRAPLLIDALNAYAAKTEPQQ